MNKSINKSVYFFILFTAFIIYAITAFSSTHSVHAGSGGGIGSPIHNGRAGDWYHSADSDFDSELSSGTSDAWKVFVEAAKRGGRRPDGTYAGRTESRVEDIVRGLRMVGDFDGTLLDACKNSRYIWWYGTRFSTQIGNAHPDPQDMSYDDIRAMESFQAFMDIENNGWGEPGGTILVCSFAFSPPEPPVELTFTSNSGTFLYNGSSHTVSGYRLNGSLKSGHSHTAAASRSRRSVGSSNVPFTTSARISSGNTNVTDEYDITHLQGTIEVVARITGPSERCYTVETDRATEIVQNDISIANGFSPQGSPGIAAVTKENKNDAHSLLSSKPSEGDSKSAWTSWKRSFEAGGDDLSTLKFNLEDHANAGNVLSKYGGVINVTRTHHPYRVEVEICQPQKRDQHLENGRAVWGDWYDDPDKGEEIESINQTKRAVQNYSYQILGVNCNVDGLNRVMDNFNTTEADWGIGDGTVSGFIQTETRSGLHFPLGKSSHYTGKEVFYRPDGDTWDNSCEDSYENACVSTAFDTSVANDAHNNLEDAPMFTHIDDEQSDGHSYPNEDTDQLNFFRDNSDREVRADVWYPKNVGVEGLANTPGERAIRTSARIFNNEYGVDYTPTPEIDITTIKPWEIDDKFTSLSPGQREKEWANHVNRFNIKSQWSSEKEKPYALGVDWTYGATAMNTAPREVDGYEVLNQTSYPKMYNFEVQCTFQNEPGTHDANVTEFPFADSGTNLSPEWDGAGMIEVLFTRSVSDRSQ